MEKLQLKSTARDLAATTPEKLRKTGLLPAVLYGHNLPTTPLTIVQSDFARLLKKAGESTIIELVTADGKTHPVLIQDVQHHYLTSDPMHVDFLEVSMTEKLTAEVVLEYVGESAAVKNLGGVLVKILNQIEVESLPADLPHNIEVDLSALETFTDSIHVKNLKVPLSVKVLTDGEEIVAKIQPPRDVEAELSEPVIEDISSVEGAAENKPEAAEEGKEKKE